MRARWGPTLPDQRPFFVCAASATGHRIPPPRFTTEPAFSLLVALLHLEGLEVTTRRAGVSGGPREQAQGCR
jgi:hypothetical protein